MQPKKVTIDGIYEAHRRIAPFVTATPLLELGRTSIHLKLENVHPGVHAFKIRGVWNRLLKEPGSTIVTAAIGSHGFAVGHVCRALGKRSVCFMPKNAPEEKKEKMRRMVDGVREVGDVFSETERAAARYASTTRYAGHCFVHPYNDPLVIAGQGTVGAEIALNVSSWVYVPVGGGGLISGVALFLKEIVYGAQKKKVHIIGVQPANMHAMKRSVEKGAITTVSQGTSLAEALCVNLHPATQTLEYVRRYTDGWRLVSEDAILAAMRMIYEETGHRVEGAGAISVAAALSDRKTYGIQGRSVCIVTGGNISEERFQQAIEKATPPR